MVVASSLRRELSWTKSSTSDTVSNSGAKTEASAKVESKSKNPLPLADEHNIPSPCGDTSIYRELLKKLFDGNLGTRQTWTSH